MFNLNINKNINLTKTNKTNKKLRKPLTTHIRVVYNITVKLFCFTPWVIYDKFKHKTANVHAG